MVVHSNSEREIGAIRNACKNDLILDMKLNVARNAPKDREQQYMVPFLGMPRTTAQYSDEDVRGEYAVVSLYIVSPLLSNSSSFFLFLFNYLTHLLGYKHIASQLPCCGLPLTISSNFTHGFKFDPFLS
jgi:hypothetical protein